ncbi:glycerol-3-phosphate acyltransferase 1, mitochondrial isoform X1 [Leptopilina heterotoma]|uniref:glycerol-3-phosphate acyltransferase 1, mitochondrial isoform X1 n=2 Tax=Leptopilina heterotoma TaxID=63436 RepID=UPI001CAA1E95|nr:glycerol-3-phosphate acyltransferase 1, mitochondrial isoform X1 [Leptopilina heterotoma]
MYGLVELFIFCGVLYYLFNDRANNMVDVMSTRLHEVYAKWERRTEVPRNLDSNAPRLSLGGLRRAGQQMQRRRFQNKEQARKVREASLFKIKESEPMAAEIPRTTPFFFYCCRSCTPSSRDSLVNKISTQYQTHGNNILLVKSGTSILSKICSCINQVYNIKKYDYPQVTETVLNDERLQEAIKLTATENAAHDGGNEEDEIVKAKIRAKQILLKMQSSLSDKVLRIVAWICFKVLPCFIQSAVVQPSQIEMLQKANDTGLPMIFIPLHRSHLDYIMTTFILLCNNIKCPLVAAGDNLRIPFFGWLLSGLGAFFIKRRIDPVQGRKDKLYRATLHTYIMECLRAGHNIEFFVEGGRTRTGKPCMPKGGVLSVIIDAYLDGTIEDALLVPMSINYERLVDGNFVREQLGQPKKMESFKSAITAMWTTLMGNYGIVKVDICQPFSLREMLKFFQKQQTRLNPTNSDPQPKSLKYSISSSSLFGTDVVVEDRQLVENIARHIVYDGSKSTPIMSTNVIAFLLLYKFRDGCTLDDLVNAVDSMRQELEFAKRDAAFSGESIDVINHALDILGPGLVKQQRQEITETVNNQIVKSGFRTAIQPVSILPNVIELSYYANTMVLHYILESVVVTALYADLKSQMNDPRAIAENDIKIYQDDLVERAIEVCDILKYEFIFCRPCQELEHVIVDVIRGLCSSGIISLIEEAYLEEELWSRRYAKTFDDSSDEEYSNVNRTRKIQYKLSLIPEHSDRMEFLHRIARPLIDTYSFSAFSLKKLVSRSTMEKEFLQEILKEIKSNIDSGAVSYGESLSIDPVKNSLKLFEKWNVLECYSQENTKLFSLKDEYDDDVAINRIFEKVAAYKWTRNVD